jgi:hypothetical protein
MIERAVKEKFPSLPAKYSASLAAGYVARFRDTILQELRQRREQFAADYAARQAPFDTITSILSSMKDLADQSSKAVGEIIVMAQQETGMPLEVGGIAAPEGELTVATPFTDRSAA